MHITSDSKQAENTYCSPSSPSIPQFQPWRSSNPRTCRRRWPLHLGLPSRWRPTGDLWQPMLKCCAYIAVWSCLTQGCFPDLAVVRYRKSPTLGFWSQRNVSWDSMWVKCDIHIHSQHMWAVPQMGVPQNKLVMSYNGKFRGTPILGNPWKPPCVWPEFVQSLCQGPGVFLGLAGCLPRCVRRTDGLVWRGRSWARPAVSDGHHRRYPTEGLQQVGTVPDWDCCGLVVASKTIKHQWKFEAILWYGLQEIAHIIADWPQLISVLWRLVNVWTQS